MSEYLLKYKTSIFLQFILVITKQYQISVTFCYITKSIYRSITKDKFGIYLKALTEFATGYKAWCCKSCNFSSFKK